MFPSDAFSANMADVKVAALVVDNGSGLCKAESAVVGATRAVSPSKLVVMFLCNCRKLHVVAVEMPAVLDLTLHTGDGILPRPGIMIVLGKQKCAKCSLALIFGLPVGEALLNNENACFSSKLRFKSSASC